jgi:transaldolase / glucose-6-phosphate isomerase
MVVSDADRREPLALIGSALHARIDAARTKACDDHRRLLARDASLWPVSATESARWLGWLDSLGDAPEHLRIIRPLVEELLADGVTDVVLSGMGGSSLFPEVLARGFGPAAGHPRLWVLDSTDPAAVLRVEREVPWASTVVIAASKSGGTIETLAHLARFRARLVDVRGGGATRRIIVVTDPGSPLEDRARSQGFRAIVHGEPRIGGRYSALSPFGLLPAALLGIDLERLLARAGKAEQGFEVDPWSDGGPAQLAAVMAAAIDDGRDVMHLLVPGGLRTFGGWIEQLVAESTGKQGTGLLPVITDRPEEIHDDHRRFVVALGDQPGLDALGAQGTPVLVLPWEGRDQLLVEVLRWLQAVPLLCASIGVDPFDQPDVASAKAATAVALREGRMLEGARSLGAILEELSPDDAYLAVLAYVDPEGAEAAALERACSRLAIELTLPVTLGLGPRYLHSTGQLHKGGRGDGRFLVTVGADLEDADVPDQPYGFSELKRAQAAGDVTALRDAGRRVDVVDLATIIA